jgi:putative NADH-flavin reductase
MKLLIFGATGSVGLPLVQQALEQGHIVTAFTRSPEKLSDMAHSRLTIFKGDILDAASVEAAVKGQECVLCVIGDGNKGSVRADGTKNIINAMKRAGVKRLICETTLGLGDSKGNLNFLWKVIFGVFLRKAFKDHKVQEEHLFGSRLDFTIVRPSAFTDGEKTGRYKVGFDANAKGLKLKIARADVADFMLKQVPEKRYLGKAVSISN